MNKTLKRLMALSIAGVMSLGCLTACGKTAGTESDTDSASSGSGGELVIGGIGPLTGGAATYGNAVKNAAELAVKEINEAGGVNGMTLKLNFQDDEHNAQKAINAYNVLKDANMKILMGTVTSAPCIAVAELTEEDNIFQITPSGSAVDSISGKNAFR
ncbi:MAG: ABC transporter substrate-binding protein, partial [Oscillospiraceae bacterium]